MSTLHRWKPQLPPNHNVGRGNKQTEKVTDKLFLVVDTVVVEKYARDTKLLSSDSIQPRKGDGSTVFTAGS